MPTITIDRSAFERLPLRRVEAWVHPHASAPGPGEAEGHVFEPGGPSRPDDPGRPPELTWSPALSERVRSLRFRAVFDGDRPAYDSPEIPIPEGADQVELTDLGVRLFDARALPFETIRTVEGSFVDLAGQPRSFRLSAGAPFFAVFAGSDYTYGEPIDYALDYLLTDGNYREPHLASDDVVIEVENPLHPKTVTFEAIGLAAEGAGADPAAGSGRAVQVVQLTYSHLEEGIGWRIAGGDADTTLSSARPTQSLTFDAVDPARALTRYLGLTIFADGDQERIPEALIPETTIRLGDAPSWWTVEVDPGLVDWNAYPVVLVEIRAVDAVAPGPEPSAQAEKAAGAHAAGEPETLLFFWPGVPSRYWSFQVPVGQSGSFAWRARYVLNDGTSEWTPERTETSHRAILPSRVPASAAESRSAGPASVTSRREAS